MLRVIALFSVFVTLPFFSVVDSAADGEGSVEEDNDRLLRFRRSPAASDTAIATMTNTTTTTTTTTTSTSSSCTGYFCDKHLDEIFLVGTHNSLALPGKVFSPNQNHGLSTQYRDGVRFFNWDLYYDEEQDKVVTSHGPGMAYDPMVSIQDLVTTAMGEPDSGEDFVLIQLQDGVRDAERLHRFLQDTGLSTRLIQDFDTTETLGDHLRRGRDVLLVTDARTSVDPPWGIHDTRDVVTENDYSWRSCYFDAAPVTYRRGPSRGRPFRLMNYFCSLIGTGDVIAADNVNQRHRILYSAREFVRQKYTGGRINGILVDYYEEGDVFGAQVQIRTGDLQDGCWDDGQACGEGTTCWNCCNDAEWWDQKFFTACGEEPCWSDGTRCAAGTTCDSCCDGYEWWDQKFFTACGQEPCWSQGATCGKGTTCDNCCSRSADCPWYKFGVCQCE